MVFRVLLYVFDFILFLVLYLIRLLEMFDLCKIFLFLFSSR